MDEFKDIPDEEVEKLIQTENPGAEFREMLRSQANTISELLDAQISNDDSVDEVKIKARKFALANLQTALNTIAELVTGAEKDSTRLAAARTIWAIAASTSVKDDMDPLTELFKKIDDGPTKRNS